VPPDIPPVLVKVPAADTFPLVSTAKGVVSGLAESSTTSALPAPVCVTVNAALAELASTVVGPTIEGASIRMITAPQ
jgi:hypothetical protein